MKPTLLLTAISFLFLLHVAHAQNPQLWGIASNGGTYSNGAIIKINGDGTGYSSVYSLKNADGSFPGGHLLYNSGDKMLYGMTFQKGTHNSGTIFKIDPSSHAFTRVHDMDTLGYAWVNSDLVRANDSAFYGLVFTGGHDQNGQIFSFNPVNNTYHVVYNFTPATGIRPRNILYASDDKLYGTTDSRGVHPGGTFFSFDPMTATYSDLKDFDSSTAATGTLMQASDGKIYGLTNGAGVSGQGYIYSYDPYTASFATLHDFDNTAHPGWINGLTEGANGNLYGMTYFGGNQGIFSYTITTGIYTFLYGLTATTGGSPVSSMTAGSDGNIYGMTTSGAANSGGAIIRFNVADSSCTTLKALTSAGGYQPFGGLTEVPAGVGINEQALTDGILLYPNPVSSRLTIHTEAGIRNEELIISVFDALGELITTANHAWQQDILIDTKRLSAGLYFLQLKSESEIIVKRFVKE